MGREGTFKACAANCRQLMVSVTEDDWVGTVTIRHVRQFPPRLCQTQRQTSKIHFQTTTEGHV